MNNNKLPDTDISLEEHTPSLNGEKELQKTPISTEEVQIRIQDPDDKSQVKQDLVITTVEDNIKVTFSHAGFNAS